MKEGRSDARSLGHLQRSSPLGKKICSGPQHPNRRVVGVIPLWVGRPHTKEGNRALFDPRCRRNPFNPFSPQPLPLPISLLLLPRRRSKARAGFQLSPPRLRLSPSLPFWPLFIGAGHSGLLSRGRKSLSFLALKRHFNWSLDFERRERGREMSPRFLFRGTTLKNSSNEASSTRRRAHIFPSSSLLAPA